MQSTTTTTTFELDSRKPLLVGLDSSSSPVPQEKNDSSVAFPGAGVTVGSSQAVHFDVNRPSNDPRFPHKAEEPKGWFRWVGGLAYNEVRNFVGWIGAVGATTGLFATVRRLSIPALSMLFGAVNPGFLIPVAMIEPFLNNAENGIFDPSLTQATVGVDKAIGDKHFKDGKDSFKDYLRKLFGITKEGVNLQIKPNVIRRTLGNDFYYAVAEGVTDALALVGGFANTVKNVGILYVIVRAAHKLVTGSSDPVLPETVSKFASDVIQYSAIITVGKKAVEAVGTWGYRLAGWAMDKTYGAGAGAGSFVFDKAADTTPGEKIANARDTVYNAVTGNRVSTAIYNCYQKYAPNNPFNAVSESIDAYAKHTDYSKDEAKVIAEALKTGAINNAQVHEFVENGCVPVRHAPRI